MSPYLFAAAVGGKDMATVLRWIDTNEEREVMSILQRAGVPEAMTAFEANMKRDERTKSSIFTTAETIIDAYNDPLVCESAANPTIFSSELLNGGKNTLYICAPSHEQDRLQTIFTAIVSQMKSAAYELAGKQNKAVDPPLLICIDEAANIAPLEDLDAIASTAAGIGIQLVTIFQDMAQIEARYKERARTVINNHRAKVVLSGISDSGTLEYVSKLIGEEDIDSTSVSISAQGERSTTESKQQRTLASGSYLRRMKFGEGIVVYGQLAPAKLVLRPWYKDRVLKHMVEFGAKPGTVGGPAGSNSFRNSTGIAKDHAAVPHAGAVATDARYSSGDQSFNQNATSQMPIAPGTPGSIDPNNQSPVAPTAGVQGQSEMSAFDKALAELRARDSQGQPLPPTATPPATYTPGVPTVPPITPAAPVPPTVTPPPATPPATYTPGVPLYPETPATTSDPASPKKWKPSGGGVSEEETDSGGGFASAPVPAPTEPVVPPIVPEERPATPPVSESSSKWGKGSHPTFKETPPQSSTPPVAPTVPQAPVPSGVPTVPPITPAAPVPPTVTPPPATPPATYTPGAPAIPPSVPQTQTPDVADIFAQYSESPTPPSSAPVMPVSDAESVPEEGVNDDLATKDEKPKWK